MNSDIEGTVDGLELRLNVDRKNVRYLCWDNEDRLRNLVPVWILELMLQGYPFSVDREQEVRTFFSLILVKESEFEIIKTPVLTCDLIPSRWSKIDVLSQNYVARFAKLYREHFRGYLDVDHNLISNFLPQGARHQHVAPHGYIEFKALKVRFSQNSVSHLSDDEAFFVYICSIAYNEITALKRIAMLTTEFISEDGISSSIAFSNEFTIAKLTAGKIFEGWELLRKFYFSTQLSQKYKSNLGKEYLEDLNYLKIYFNGSNILKRTRDKLAFHYSGKDRDNSLVAIGRRDFSFLLAENYLNSIFHSADRSAFEAMAMSDEVETERALAQLRGDIAEVGGRMCYLFKELIKLILDQLGDGSNTTASFDELIIDSAPARNFSGLPTLLNLEDFHDFHSAMDGFVDKKK